MITSLNTNVVQHSRNKTTNWHFHPETGSGVFEQVVDMF
jgi:hypothetical protein